MPSAVEVELATPAPTGKMTPPLLLQPAKLDEKALETASNILGIISRYRLSHKPTPKSDEGDLKFLAQIYSKVRAGRLINMCLPAFPFKSPNSTTKVLGYLPDKAEEVALANLNGLCDAIKNIYPPGSELTIISDGLVYNGKRTVVSTVWFLHTEPVIPRSPRRSGQKCLGLRRGSACHERSK